MSKQIRKIKLPGDNEEYELISTIQTDAAGVEIGRQINVGDEKLQTANAKATSALAQGDYIFRLGATETNPSDYRFNEAYGTGSIAAGMGAVAYSRASKSFGYRTQTGMPSKKEQTEHRPEDISIDVSFVIDSTYDYNYKVEKNLLQYTAYGTIEEGSIVTSQGHTTSFDVIPNKSRIALSISAPNGLLRDSQVRYTINDKNNYYLSLTENNEYNATVILEQVTKLTIEETFSNSDLPLNITLSAWPAENVGQAAMAIGSDTVATANNAFAGGYRAKATETNSFAFGGTDGTDEVTIASAAGAVAMGASVKATGVNSFATGLRTHAQGAYSHAEGQDTEATQSYAHAEGKLTHATAAGAHAEGQKTWATYGYSHAEGEESKAENYYAHAEGKATQAAGQAAHAEGRESKAIGAYSHAEGYNTSTSKEAQGAHAEGQNTSASAAASHAAGINTQAKHTGSTATGNSTITGRNYQVVIGQFNDVDTNALFVVGNGTADNDRKNAFVIKEDGSLVLQGISASTATINNLTVNGTLTCTSSSWNNIAVTTIRPQQIIFGGKTYTSFTPFYATNTTSFSQVRSAFEKGLSVYYKQDNNYYALNKISGDVAYFGSKSLTGYDAQIPPKTS